MSVIIDSRTHATNAVAVNIDYDITQLDLSGSKIQVKFDTKIVGGVGSKFIIRHSDGNYKSIGENGEYWSPVLESSTEGTSHIFTVDITDELIQNSKFLTVTTNGASGTDKVNLEVTNIEISTLAPEEPEPEPEEEHTRINAGLIALKAYQLAKNGSGGGSQALGDMDGLYERIYPTSKNLFNHNQLIYGGRLNRNTGEIIDSDKDCYTEYIPVKENTPYTISEQGAPYSAVAYDSEYNHITGYLVGGAYGDTTINTPINTSFLRYSFIPVSGYEKIMLNEGTEILPFEEYQDQGNRDKTVAGVFNYLLDNPQNNGGGGVSEQVTRAFNAGEVINVEKYSSAILDLQFGAADYHLEGSRNGTDYERLQVIKTNSGTPYQRISVRSEYAVNLTGYTHIRLVLDFLALNPQNFRITLSTETFKNNIDTRPNTFYAPKKPKFEYTLNETGNVTYLSGDKNGIVYGVTTDEVFKSSDYGKKWESLGTPAIGAHIQYVQKLDNGNVLALSKYGTEGKSEYFILDTTEGTWQSKYTHEVQGSYNPGFGFDVYDNVILFAPYQNPKETELIQVHYSNDYGETWKPIFDSPTDIQEWHIHDVAYDPYTDRIYIANGDNIDGLNADIIWSADEGKTWNYAFDGKPRSQFTAIMPTPTQIIFGTDESRVRGAFRHPRGVDNPFVLDPAFHDMEPGGVNKHIVVGRGSHYWDTGNVVYLYARNPAEIYATKDGYNYFSMLKIGSDDTPGSLQNLAPLHDGKMAIGYRDKDGKGYVMVIENVEWEEM